MGGRACGKDEALAACVWNGTEGVPGTLLMLPAVSEAACQSVISFTDLPCVCVCALSSHHPTHIPESVSPPPFLFLMCECYLCRYKCVPVCCIRQCLLVILEVFVSFSWGSRAAAERTATAHVTAFVRQWDRSKAKKPKRQGSVALARSPEAARSMKSPFTRAKKREKRGGQ